MMFDEVFMRHSNVALQFSGGKDSLALLHFMRPYWDRLTVYYCNSGNPMPETIDLVSKVKAMVPRFVMVMGRQPQVVTECGYPSDIVPYASTRFGRQRAGDTGTPMIDRYACCAFSIMQPLHERMVADEITLIIRGQRNADEQKSPLRSGMVAEGIEMLFPIENWTDEEVYDFLKSSGVSIPRYYEEGLTSAPDCMDCTAWLKHGQVAYMKKYHPYEHEQQQARLRRHLDEITPVFARLVAAVEKEN